MSATTEAFSFDCDGSALLGMLHAGAVGSKRGVLIVVGGPQYRVGSHRQFVLLARNLASTGVPVMRFDYRGMGDSDGPDVGFLGVNADIEAAISEFVRRVPSLREIVLLGLCDAVSAMLIYAHTDQRVRGLVALNPWVRTERGLAETYVRHYYLRRMLSGDLWRKIVTGKFEFGAAAKSLIENISAIMRPRTGEARGPVTIDEKSFPAAMLAGLRAYDGRSLFVYSGEDLTASEFRDLVTGSAAWRDAMNNPQIDTRELGGANHTFARHAWRTRVSGWVSEWLASW